MNQFVAYDTNGIVEKIRERIRAEVMTLLPEDAIKQLVEQETKRFLEDCDEEKPPYAAHLYSPHQPKPAPSGLKQIVRSELDAYVNERVKALLSSDEWSVWFDGHGHTACGDVLLAKLKEMAPKIVENAIGQMIMQALRGMR